MPGFVVGETFVPWYGLMMVIGLLIGGGLACFLVWKAGKSVLEFYISMLYAILFGILGAKLLYLFVARDEIQWNMIFNKEYFTSLMRSGFVFYGGLITGVLAMFLVKKLHKIDVFSFAGYALPCLPIIHGFGRIGCHLSGCCYGRPYDGMGSVTYRDSIAAPNGISLFPVQLTEALCNFLLAGVLLIYSRKTKDTRRVLYVYLMIYGIVRFSLEFLRYDSKERGYFGMFSTSQWISMAMIGIGLVCFVRTCCKTKNNVV